MMEINETLDDLQNGYFIIQNNNGFKFGIDAVILSDFAKEVSGRVIDLCTGTGIIPLLLAAKSQAELIDAIELQKSVADMAERSVRYNGLEDRIHIKCADICEAQSLYGKGVFDAVTVNPPFMKKVTGLLNCLDAKTVSRHEITCTLEDVIRVSSELLKPLGKFFMVHRPARLTDILYLMRKYKTEPKTIRLIAPEAGKEPNLVLVKGIRGAKCELKMMPTLYVYESNGSYTKEIDAIYGR